MVVEASPIPSKEGARAGRRKRPRDPEEAQDEAPPVHAPARALDPERWYLLEFDGASRRNPGRAAYGFVIRALHPPSSSSPSSLPPGALPVVDGGPPAAASSSSSSSSPPHAPHSSTTNNDDNNDPTSTTTTTPSPPWSEGSAVLAGSGCLPRGHSNNQAEYAALAEGLRAALAAGARRVVARGDSQLVVQQLAGNFAAGSPRLTPLLARVKELARFPGATVAVQHVPRAQNAAADSQANAALDALLALEQAARAAPSAYERAARRVAAALPALDPRRALDLPLEDDFAGAVARAAGEAMGVPPALLRRRMRDAEEVGTASASASAAAATTTASGEAGQGAAAAGAAAAAAATRLKQWEAATVAAGWRLEAEESGGGIGGGGGGAARVVGGGGGRGRAANSSSTSSSSSSSSESEEDGEGEQGAARSSPPPCPSSLERLERHHEDSALGCSVTAHAGPPVPGATLRTLRWASFGPHSGENGNHQQQQQQQQQPEGGGARKTAAAAASDPAAAGPPVVGVGGPDVATLAAALAASEGHIMVVRGAHGVPVPLSPEALEWHVEGGRFGAGGAAGDGEGTAATGGGGGAPSLSDADADAALAAAAAHMPTHLLLFDGASRNNPGRASFGFVLYDLRQAPLAALAGALLEEQQQQEQQQQQQDDESAAAATGASSSSAPLPARRRKRGKAASSGAAAALASSASLRAVCRGARSLPYGTSAAQAEYQGLLAGLEAAAAAGVRRLAVRGDSALVVGQLRSRACGSAPAVARLYVRARQLLDGAFERADVALVPRAANGAADQLARRALDLDSALYSLLRGDGRSLRLAAARGLAGVASAARLRQVAAEVGVALARPSEGGGGGDGGQEEEAEEGDDEGFLKAVLGARAAARGGKEGGCSDGDGADDSSPLPRVLAQLTWRLVSLPAPALLGRLEDKAARLGDPNPWLVQRVRALVAAQRAAVDEALLRRWGVFGAGTGGGEEASASAASAAASSGRPKSKKQGEQDEQQRAWLRQQLLQPGGPLRQQALMELAGMHPAGGWRPPPMPKQAKAGVKKEGGGGSGVGAAASSPLLPPLAAAACGSSTTAAAALTRAYATSSSATGVAGRLWLLPPLLSRRGVGVAASSAPHFAPGRRDATFAAAARRLAPSGRGAAAAVFAAAALVGGGTLA